MRALLITLLSLQVLTSSAQTWRNVDIRTMNPFTWAYSGSGGSENTRYFRINPYNNDIWLTYGDAVQQLTGDGGQYFYYNNSNTPLFPVNSSFRDFGFTSNYTFALSGNYGLYQLSNSVWNLAVPFDEGVNLNYELDTVWCIRNGENYLKWAAGVNSQSTVNVCSKAISNNGLLWGGAQYDAVFKVDDDQQYSLYSPDTSKLMDWGNWDMKFYPDTDSLFVANDGGFAIADGITFVDSICSANCTNMPGGKILEFEFDANKNIWALMGNGGLYVKTGLAHYNVTTKVWDQYYDESNSSINFGYSQISIEIDTLGNLWVVDKYFLHILDEGNTPTWLGMKEIPAPFALNVYPNPSNELINLAFEGNSAVLTIRDVQGKEISTSAIISGENISLNELPAGVYLFEVVTEKGSVVKRVVKN